MSLKLITGLAISSFLLAAVSLEAHHSFAAEFDATRPVLLEGTVSKVEWTNPHIWIHVDVPSPDGSVVTWAVEGAAPNSMIRRGILKTSVPVGVKVTVEGFASKSGQSIANGRNIQWPGGTKLFFGSAGTGAPSDGAEPGAQSR